MAVIKVALGWLRTFFSRTKWALAVLGVRIVAPVQLIWQLFCIYIGLIVVFFLVQLLRRSGRLLWARCPWTGWRSQSRCMHLPRSGSAVLSALPVFAPYQVEEISTLRQGTTQTQSTLGFGESARRYRERLRQERADRAREESMRALQWQQHEKRRE